MTDTPGDITYVREPILQEKEKTHGNFKVNADIWLKLGAAGYDTRLNPQQRLVLTMIYVKLARILSGQANFKDHWTDIAGYAKLGEEACD